MTQTFKNDESFFTVIMPVRTPVRFWDIYKWVELDSNAKFRFIRDFEIEQDRLTAKEVEEIYPGVKTIGIVTNPWARVAWSYAVTLDPPSGYPGVSDIKSRFEGIDFTTFETYVDTMQTCKDVKGSYHPTDLQSRWLEYDNRSVDFLLKAESINEDFKIVQDYFCTARSLEIENFNFNYKPYYTDRSKIIVENIFAYDIEKYGYSF
jgi:hypothetical protein